jgi:hypothetical protein
MATLILSTTKPSLSSSERRSGTRKSSLLNQAPKLTPICLTPALALELLTTATHSPSTFRADPIQNVGDKLRIRLDVTQSEKGHTHLAPYWFELRYCVSHVSFQSGSYGPKLRRDPFGRCRSPCVSANMLGIITCSRLFLTHLFSLSRRAFFAVPA